MGDNKTIDLNKGATLFEMFDYLCSKVDWEKSALDSEAITCMNSLFVKLGLQKEVIKQ